MSPALREKLERLAASALDKAEAAIAGDDVDKALKYVDLAQGLARRPREGVKDGDELTTADAAAAALDRIFDRMTPPQRNALWRSLGYTLPIEFEGLTVTELRVAVTAAREVLG